MVHAYDKKELFDYDKLCGLYDTARNPIPLAEEESVAIKELYVHPIKSILVDPVQSIWLGPYGIKFDREL
jgi:hypothetical protein